MKQIVHHKRFVKHYKLRVKINPALDRKFLERLKQFQLGVRGEPINDHALSGRKSGMCAFSVTGDVRVIYHETATEYEFLDIGTHNQVY